MAGTVKQNRKRILYYESGSGFGGSAHSLYRLTKYLDRSVFCPYVIVHGLGPPVRKMLGRGITVRKLRFYYPIPDINDGLKWSFNRTLTNVFFYFFFSMNTILTGVSIYRTIKAYHIDLVHLNNGIFENLPALLASKVSGIPCISHVRGTEPLTRVERIFGRLVEKIITLNSKMNELYKSTFGHSKSCIIFNGVDLEAFEEPEVGKLARLYEIPQDQFVVGTIARLVPGKGIPEFIKAAAEVLKISNKFSFFIIGDDPFADRSFENDLRQLASYLGLGSSLLFTGWRDDVLDLMSGLDLVVQFSTFPEGMSLTPIEAMALSKPVITSDVPGYTDTIEDGITGYIVPSGDVEKLADRILEIGSNKRLAIIMGENGRKKVEKEFDIRLTVARIQNIYREIMAA